jgi:F-type H+-transporting ATPase subunit gamma
MIQTLRQIKARIRGIENTWKITRAMEMVAVSKLRRLQSALGPLRAYFGKLDHLVQNYLADLGERSHPFLEAKKRTKTVALCLITSDSGLCGTYNESLIRVAKDFISRYGAKEVNLIAIGKKGFTYFKRQGMPISHAYVGLHGRISPQMLKELTGVLTSSFISGEVDEVYVAYTRFESAARYRPTIEKILNLEPSPNKPFEYIVEPDYSAVLQELLPLFILKKIHLMLMESMISEFSARALSMRSATDNAKELIEGLILLRNKVRQSTITKEVLEIVSTAEALKG